MSDMEIERISNWDRPGSLDEYVTEICLMRTFRDVIRLREYAINARAYYVASLIFNACEEADIGIISEIIERIDGTVPSKDDREKYANLIGDALEDVMEQGQSTVGFSYDDPVIICLAKTILYIATMDCDKSPTKRKDRQKANEIILKRTGGRRNEPVKEIVTLNYVDPDWMALPE